MIPKTPKRAIRRQRDCDNVFAHWFFAGVIALALSLAGCQSSDTDTDEGRGQQIDEPSSASAGGSPQRSEFGDYHAVIIGINDYLNWPTLDYAEGDAGDIYRILRESYGFLTENTVFLFGEEATRSRILMELRTKLESLGDDDNLLVFYAGHGQLDPLTGSGFWVPVGGHLFDDSSWIRFSTILEYMKASNVSAKSVLIVTDSCYGGAINRAGPTPGQTRPDQDWSRYENALRDMASARSRHVIASGGYEQVPDKSDFADLLKTALDENQYPMIDMEYLFFTSVYPGLRQIGLQEPVMSRVVTGPDANGQFILIRDIDSDTGEDEDPYVVFENDSTGTGIDHGTQKVPAPAPQLSSLIIRSNVNGDAVYVDGDHKGETRQDLDVIPGKHSIVVRKSGYHPYETIVEALPDQHHTINAVLKRIEIPTPVISEFTAKPLSARPGDTVTLIWRTENTEKVEIDAAGGNSFAASGTTIVKPGATTTYRLLARNSAGVAAERSLTISVSAKQPKIVDFEATPKQLRKGDTITLTWQTQDAVAVSIPGVTTKTLSPNGSVNVVADDTDRFELIAINADKESTKALVEIAMLGPPQITSFKADSTTITKGNSTHLRWGTIDADTVKFRSTGKSVLTQGSLRVSPDKTTTYTLLASGGSMNASKSVTITVRETLVPVQPQLRIPTNTLTATKLTLAPKVLSSGNVSLKQTYTLDMDTGRTSAGAESDMWFEAKTATQRYITPRNGAKTALIRGGRSPGYTGCKNAAFATGLVAVRYVAPGNFICIKTNRGRISQFTPTRSVGASPGTIVGTYTTWQ